MASAATIRDWRSEDELERQSEDTDDEGDLVVELTDGAVRAKAAAAIRASVERD